MNQFVEKYLEVSEASSRAKKEFDSLASCLSISSRDPTNVVIQIKEELKRHGYSYNDRYFRGQDVLAHKSGNCLGLPLLIGSLMGEVGLTPTYRIVVNPQDKLHELEKTIYQRLCDEMRYDDPSLAVEQEAYPHYRFAPLEHLVFDVNGGTLIETTSEEHTVSKFESARALDFDGGLSCLCKDMAIEENNSGNTKKAIELARKALALWGSNRQIHAFLAGIAAENGNEKDFEEARRKYEEIGGNDSLFHFNRYMFTGNGAFLNSALHVYPQYGPAIAMNAFRLAQTDERESKFLYALASQLYAQSHVLYLRDFYTTHAKNLKKLFGVDEVRKNMRGFVKSKKLKRIGVVNF